MFRVALFLIALTVASAASAQPAPDRYDPGRAVVADIQKIVTPNGVQETSEVELDRARQVVNVRGTDQDNPIILLIHGVPGAVERPVAWSFQRPWEDYFTVVQWDQRGAGRSYLRNDTKALSPRPAFSGPLDVDKMTVERTWSIYCDALAANRHDADFYVHAPRLSPEYTAADR